MGRLGTIAAATALTGCTAPILTVRGPDAPVVSGVVALTIETDARRVRASVNGGAPFELTTAALDTRDWPDGVHTVTIEASSLVRSTSAQVGFATDNSPPAVLIWEQAMSVEQGHTLPVVLRTDEPAELSVRILGEERPLYPIGAETWRALVGVPIRADAGPHPLTVTARDALGNAAELAVDVQVRAVAWPFTGKLPLSKRKAAVAEPDVERMRAERDAVYATATPDQRWTGPMRLPVEGAEHTSPFGTYREYPDGTRSHHDAEDLARRRWTPIHAAADGVVALARYQAVHGNAVLIDHGHQVVGLYSHLQELDVTEGQRVRTGDRLGWMGSTGRSTGPHLHWGVVVDGVPVDPMQWTETAFVPDPDAVFLPLAPAAAR